MSYYVYILFSQHNGTLYIGVTNNLPRRVYEHKNKLVKGFSQKYNVNKLGYYEIHKDIYSALTREKQLNAWKRDWKKQLIEQSNPDWLDLYNEII